MIQDDVTVQVIPSSIVILRETREVRMERVMTGIAAAVPSMKGLGPKDRSTRLLAELERRIKFAREALYG